MFIYCILVPSPGCSTCLRPLYQKKAKLNRDSDPPDRPAYYKCGVALWKYVRTYILRVSWNIQKRIFDTRVIGMWTKLGWIPACGGMEVVFKINSILCGWFAG